MSLIQSFSFSPCSQSLIRSLMHTRSCLSFSLSLPLHSSSLSPLSPWPRHRRLRKLVKTERPSKMELVTHLHFIFTSSRPLPVSVSVSVSVSACSPGMLPSSPAPVPVPCRGSEGHGGRVCWYPLHSLALCPWVISHPNRTLPVLPVHAS